MKQVQCKLIPEKNCEEQSDIQKITAAGKILS